MMSTVNFAYNDTQRDIKKVSLFAKCRYTRSLIIRAQTVSPINRLQTGYEELTVNR